ncbi:hypothetical protein AB1Y20_012324 [Prymnesium parvum]|uniref:Uncharacterized protein n=1 Tax=Prymnesium parvum TaxID=97485 RepID=A0AB34IRR1_PRYPA
MAATFKAFEHLTEIMKEVDTKREDNRTLREAKKRKREEEKGREAALSLLENGAAVEALLMEEAVAFPPAKQSAQPEETPPDGVAEEEDDTTDSFCGALVPSEPSALLEELPPLADESQEECGNNGSAVAPSSPTEPNRDQISTWLDDLYLQSTCDLGQKEYDTDDHVNHSTSELSAQSEETSKEDHDEWLERANSEIHDHDCLDSEKLILDAWFK